MHREFLKGDTGLIALNEQGDIAFGFNTNLMKRGYRIEGKAPVVALWDYERI